jgi:hypothetical protein
MIDPFFVLSRQIYISTQHHKSVRTKPTHTNIMKRLHMFGISFDKKVILISILKMIRKMHGIFRLSLSMEINETLGRR